MILPYTAVLGARCRTLLQYRAAALAGFVTQLFWGLIRVMIFEAFYRSSTAPQPMSLPQVVNYVWLGQAMLVMFPWNVDTEIRELVRSGAVAHELIRPVDLYTLWFARALAMRTAPTLLRAVPMFVVAGLFLGLQPPASVIGGLGWIAATIGALLLSCAITTLLHLSLFWTLSGEGISRLVPMVAYVCSGMILPLPLYPEAVRTALFWLPFQDLVDVPFRIYVGHISPTGIPLALAHQGAWLIALVLLGRAITSHATRRVVVEGG